MSSTDYSILQQRFLSDKLVLRAGLEAITPILTGGYNGRYEHRFGREGLRPASVKGVWRWWARALLAGAIYRRYGVFPTLRTSDEVASLILGSQSMASMYSLKIRPGDGSGEWMIKFAFMDGVPRIKLLLQGPRRDRNEKAPGPGVRYELTIYRRIGRTGEAVDDFAAWSLIVSLVMDGVGKITSRGFGKFRVTINAAGKEVDRGIIPILERLYSSSDSGLLESTLKTLLGKAVEKADHAISYYKDKVEEILGKGETSTSKPLMEIPLIDEGFMTVEVVGRRYRESIDALKDIGRSTLKASHKAMRLKEEKKCRDGRECCGKTRFQRGGDVHTWILGLPRSQSPGIIRSHDPRATERIRRKLGRELERQRGISRFDHRKMGELKSKVGFRRGRIHVPTGYYYLGSDPAIDLEPRRKSPVRFTLVKNYAGHYYIVVFAFKTGEWDRLQGGLVHVGARWRRRNGVVDVSEFYVSVPSVDVVESGLSLKMASRAKKLIEERMLC